MGITVSLFLSTMTPSRTNYDALRMIRFSSKLQNVERCLRASVRDFGGG